MLAAIEPASSRKSLGHVPPGLDIAQQDVGKRPSYGPCPDYEQALFIIGLMHHYQVDAPLSG